ncbi:MAG: GNAT family N-acetyltransferase [Verrucomicrobiales bacterium]|nr:GNAT family N-acetyltransferase [Verrucomicrobiales bacterium]
MKSTSPNAVPTSITELDPLVDSAKWDGYVDQQPQGTIFHTSAWARLLAETYQLRPTYLVQKAGDQIIGAVPWFETGGLWPKRRGVSVPFADVCGPLGTATEISSAGLEPQPREEAMASHKVVATSKNTLDTLAATDPLLAASLQLGRAKGWHSLEYRDVPQWASATGSSVEFYGHTIDLTGGEEAVMGRMSSATARSTRKAERQELQVRCDTSLASAKAYFELHCLTRKRHGQPPQPWSFFAAIQKHLLAAGRGTILLVLKDERPIAGAVFLFQGVGALYKFGASDENYQSLRPNNRLFWEAIKLCMHRGYNSLDLGRTSLANEGLRRFKLGWGSIERRISYLRYDLRDRRVIPTPDATEGWHTKVFQSLPIPVARLLGKIAYRLAA